MAARPKTGKRLATSASFPKRKIAPIDDQKTIHLKDFKQEKLNAGVQAADGHDYLEAVKQFSLIKPDTTISLYLCGCARIKLDHDSQTQEAIVDFTKCLELAAQTKEPPFILDVWYKRAFAFHNVKRYDEAIKDYTKFIHRCKSLGDEDESNLHKGLLRRGLTYQAMYELSAAFKDVNEANKLTNNSNPYYLCCRASVHLSNDEREKALEDLKRASSMGCDQDPEALLQRAIVLRELGKHDAALNDLQKALVLSGSSTQQADISFQQGLNEYDLKNKEKASHTLARAITMHPFHAQAYFHLGMIQAENEQYKEALKTLTRAHELAPQQGDILLERANVNRQLGNLDNAAHDQKRGMQLNTSSLSIVTMLAARIKNLREGTGHTGTTPHTHLELAMAYDGLLSQNKSSNAKLEYYKEAVNEYQVAIETDTKYLYPQARALLILCEKKMNDLLEAHEGHLEFYDILGQHEGSVYHWKAYLLEIKNKMEVGKLEPHLDEIAVSKLIHMELNRRKKIIDEETFQNDTEDPYKNQLAFYERFRIDLSNVLAAINMLSLDRDTILHNIGSTSSKVGKIIEMLTGNLTSVADIESILNSDSKVNVKALHKVDFDHIKMKLKVIGYVGDMMEQIDVAQLVARHICTRYRSQFSCLKANKHDTVESVEATSSPWWKCCGSGNWLSTKQSTYPDEGVIAEKIATFATAFIIHALNSEIIKVPANEKSSRKDVLATTLVLVVSRAYRNVETNYFPNLRYGKENLPIEPAAVLQMLEEAHVSTDDMITSAIEWNLYDFFRAPGIYYHADGDAGKRRHYGSGPSMRHALYGYRLGTREEVDVFKRLNQNKELVYDGVKK